MHRLPVAALAGAFACIAVSAALAGATPISPEPGAVVRSSHPVFRWNLPANERAEAVYVASAPQTTPEGRFFSENIVESGFFSADAREWAPESPLYAGRYWWVVSSNDRDTYENRYSQPSPFTIPVDLQLRSVRTTARRYTFIPSQLDVEVRWTANVREAIVEARLFRGRRQIWIGREREEYVSVGRVSETEFDWTRPRRMRRGTRLTLRVAIRAEGAVTTAARVVRAP